MKWKILLVLIVCILLSSFISATNIYVNVSSVTSNWTSGNACTGCVAWTNPTRVTGYDASYATLVFAASTTNTSSRNLTGNNFTFNVPSGATINGITVTRLRTFTSSTSAPLIADSMMKLLKNGVPTGNDYKNTTTYLGTPGRNQTYGGPTNLWGTTWTYSDINNKSFGLVFSINKTTSSATTKTASIDYMNITVNYNYSLTVYPTFSSPAINESTVTIGESVNHTININTTNGTTLSSYIFSWTGAGFACDQWINDSVVTISGANYGMSNVETITSNCLGRTITWRVYANNSDNTWNQSADQTYTVGTGYVLQDCSGNLNKQNLTTILYSPTWNSSGWWEGVINNGSYGRGILKTSTFSFIPDKFTISFSYKTYQNDTVDVSTVTDAGIGVFAGSNSSSSLLHAFINNNVSSVNYGKLHLAYRNTSGTYVYINSQSFLKNQTSWTRVTLVYNDTEIIVYKNGIYNHTLTMQGGMAHTNISVLSILDGNGPTFNNASLDNFTIYSKALSSAEITNDYNGLHTDNIVVDYPFDNVPCPVPPDYTLQDCSGNNLALTNYNAIFNTSGYYQFNPTSSAIHRTLNVSSDKLIFNNTNFTVTAWIKLGSNNTEVDGGLYQMIVSTMTTSSKYNWRINFEHDPNYRLAFMLGNSTTSDNDYYSNPNLVNRWVFIAMSYNGSILTSCMDGSCKNYNIAPNVRMEATLNPLFIGSQNNAYNFNGSIDNVLIFNTSLSNEDLTNVSLNYSVHPESLVARYLFNNDSSCAYSSSTITDYTLQDCSGNNRIGINYNPNNGVLAKFNSAWNGYTFNGSNPSGIMISNTSFLDHNIMNITICVLANSTGNNIGMSSYVAYKGSYDNSYGITNWNNAILGVSRNATNSYLTSPDATYTVGVPFRTCVRYNSTTITSYIDGSLIGSVAKAPTLTNTYNITIGREGLGGEPSFNGTIKEVQVWNISLTDAEILQVAQNYSIHSESLVSWLRMRNDTNCSLPNLPSGDSCTYSGTGHYIITNAVCNITTNTTVQAGFDFNITNSTVYQRNNTWVKGYHDGHLISGWLHIIGN